MCIRDRLKALGVDEIIVVVGHEAKQVEDIVDGVTFVYQDQQLGTGHAVLQAKDVLADKEGMTLVLCGDAPLVRKETLKELINYHQENQNKATLMLSLIHIYKKDAIGDKKLGIAEAREEAIISALENLVTFSNDQETISWKEFISLDIIGDKARRLQIYDLFHLGYGNAKTLFKRLNLARITKQDILNKLGESK